MTKASHRAVPASRRMASYRLRMQAAGMRPVQIWLPDTRAAGFADLCRRQAEAVAAGDPAGDDLMRFIDAAFEWPEDA